MERTIREIAAVEVRRGKGGTLSPGIVKRQIRNRAIEMLAAGYSPETTIDWPEPQPKLTAEDKRAASLYDRDARRRESDMRDLKDACSDL